MQRGAADSAALTKATDLGGFHDTGTPARIPGSMLPSRVAFRVCQAAFALGSSSGSGMSKEELAQREAGI